MSQLDLEQTPGEMVQTPGMMLDVIREAASNPDTDVAKMRELLAMAKELEAERRKIEFQKALSSVQEQIPVIPRDGIIPLKTKSGENKGTLTYAKFEDIQGIVKPLLRKAGFTTTYDEQRVDDNVKQVTITLSRDGHSESFKTFVPWSDPGPGRNSTQAMVSASSYARRRALVYALDISVEGEDNDGAGDLTRITDEQALEIEDLIVDAGADRDMFLVWLRQSCRVDLVKDILARDFNRVVRMLKRKREQSQ